VGPDVFTPFGRRLVERVDVAVGQRVVDLGCGPGAVLIPAARAAGPTAVVLGVDRAPAMLRRARTAARRARLPNVALVRMDADQLALREQSVDVLLAGFALGSFPSAPHTLAACRSILRPGGRLGLSVAEGWWWEGDPRWAWHAELLASLDLRIDMSGRLGSPAVLRALLQRVGYVDVRVSAEWAVLPFNDFDAWWAWIWSHGYRAILEGMSPRQLSGYLSATMAIGAGGGATGGLSGHRLVTDGRLLMTDVPACSGQPPDRRGRNSVRPWFDQIRRMRWPAGVSLSP